MLPQRYAVTGLLTRPLLIISIGESPDTSCAKHSEYLLLDLILFILAQFISSEDGVFLSISDKSNLGEDNIKLYSVQTPDGKIGSIIYGEVEGDTLNIRDMASPISRKGYGKELFGKVEYMLGLSSIRKLKLYSNEGSYEFYNKIGLIPNDTNYLNDLLSGKKWYKPLIFTKDISPV